MVMPFIEPIPTFDLFSPIFLACSTISIYGISSPMISHTTIGDNPLGNRHVKPSYGCLYALCWRLVLWLPSSCVKSDPLQIFLLRFSYKSFKLLSLHTYFIFNPSSNMEHLGLRLLKHETNMALLKGPSNLPPRPGISTAGKAVQIRVNQFKVTKWPTKDVYQYDVRTTALTCENIH
jgi:hypothetical protein